MDRNELPLDPSYLGVPSGMSKAIFDPIARSAQTVHQSCVEINTVSKRTQNEFPFDPHHQGGPSGAAKKIPMPVVNSAQTVHISCAKINNVPNVPRARKYFFSCTRWTSW
jgi:hypothetical protein